MEFKLLNEKANPLFNRKEIEASIEAEVIPNKQEVKKLISEKFSVPPEAIKLKGIHGKFGSKTFRVGANVYNSVEDKEKIEPKLKKEKEAEKKAIEQKVEEEKTEEQTPAPEEKLAETPQEEPKQEEQNVADAGDEGSDNKSQKSNEQKGSELKSGDKSEPSGETSKE